MHYSEINYLLEAENDDIMIWSLGIPNYEDTGMEYMKVIMVPRSNVGDIEGVLKVLDWTTDNLINLHETKYKGLIRTLKIKDTKQMIELMVTPTGKSSYDNLKLIELRKTLDKIRRTPRYVVEQTNHCMKVSRPDFLIVETDAVTIKIPSKFEYPNAMDDANWDYDYLLHPNQNMDIKSYKFNKELLQTLNDTLGGGEIGQEIMNFKVPEDMHLFDGYTPNRYELLRKKMRDVSLRTKAIINVIREEEVYKFTNSEYYGVYQESRMARENKSPYTEIKYNSTYSKEVTFPSLFRDILKLQPSQYNSINGEELERMADSLNSKTEEGLLQDDLRVIIEYIKMKKMQIGNNEIMRAYEESEAERERVREEIFMANLSMVGNIESIYTYLRNVYCNAQVSLFDFSYTLGEDHNKVKLSFNYKEVSVVDQDSIGVQSVGQLTDVNNDIDFAWNSN